jgi:Xaa-Pro aminopeptidase
MFQNFEDRSDRTQSASRLARLRTQLKARGLDGFIVPRSDEHQGEYVAPSSERLAWLTGFAGSAGTAVVLADRAAIFVDGRYTLQVREQVDTALFEPVAVMETSVADWLKRETKDLSIGYDPWLLTRSDVGKIEAALKTVGGSLVALEANPLDAIWDDRPAPPTGPVFIQEDDLAGRAPSEKIADVAAAIAEKQADAAVISDPASVAWLFNIRGGDVPHTPLPLSFAYVPTSGRPEIFIDGRKLSNAVRDRIENFGDVHEPGALGERLAALSANGKRVLYDAQGSAEALARIVESAGGTVVAGADPVALPKAKKSSAEIAGTRRAHVRDGVAMARFLFAMEQAEPGSLTEIDATKMLEKIRAETAEAEGSALLDISFDTISSTGPNGAINHYRVSERTNRRLEPGDLYLVDSGAQYRDGTTDVTRTLLIGEAAPARLDLYRDRYTRVLKGHIALAMARFPKGTSGAQLDALARSALWSAGLDFDHGTGHGVGVFLSVHEGPQRISKTGHVALAAGMILSNEPGYYVARDYGIRLENLIVVRDLEAVPGGDRPMHSFETITLAPFERRLIQATLLSSAERAWLDSYHSRVYGALSGFAGLSAEERAWLAAACRPFG